MTLRIGIDVGGTNTDAVLLAEDRTVLAAVKRPTTSDIESGPFASQFTRAVPRRGSKP